jgi:hypothetical protein
MKEGKSDPVNHPAHYTFGKREVIEVLEEWFPSDPLLWQAGKYLARAGRKGETLEDLEKAAWYLNRRIERGKEKHAAHEGQDE